MGWDYGGKGYRGPLSRLAVNHAFLVGPSYIPSPLNPFPCRSVGAPPSYACAVPWSRLAAKGNRPHTTPYTRLPAAKNSFSALGARVWVSEGSWYAYLLQPLPYSPGAPSINIPWALGLLGGSIGILRPALIWWAYTQE